MKNLDSKTCIHETGKEDEDKDVERLEREVRMAELKQKKAEYERPLEIDKAIGTINRTLDGREGGNERIAPY